MAKCKKILLKKSGCTRIHQQTQKFPIVWHRHVTKIIVPIVSMSCSIVLSSTVPCSPALFSTVRYFLALRVLFIWQVIWSVVFIGVCSWYHSQWLLCLASGISVMPFCSSEGIQCSFPVKMSSADFCKSYGLSSVHGKFCHFFFVSAELWGVQKQAHTEL